MAVVTSFPKDEINELYPHAIMIPPMKIGVFPNTRGITLHEICTGGDYFANTKKDGAMYTYNRATESTSYLFGRTISKATGLLTEKGKNVPHIMSFLDKVVPVGTVLVGEIYYPRMTSKDVTKIMGCLPKTAINRQKNNPIHYYIHDILYYNGEDITDMGALDRFKKIRELFSNVELPSYVEIADFFDSSEVDLEEVAAEQIAHGEEGLVLKNKTAPYSPGLRPAWVMIKLKKNDTVDVVGVEAIEPTKEYSGDNIENWAYCIDAKTEERLIGKYGDFLKAGKDVLAVTKPYYNNWYTAMSIGAYDKDGKLNILGTVSSGFNDLERETLKDYEGKVLTLKVMQKNNNEHTLRHPIFEQVHADKNPEDCTLEEIF